MMVGLTIGRDVHYVAPGSADGTYPPAHRAAKITEIQDKDKGVINLIVFNPTGVHFVQGITFDEGSHGPFTWHWPEDDA